MGMIIYVLRLETLCDYEACEPRHRWLGAPIHVIIIMIINTILHLYASTDLDGREMEDYST
jgi:hypothetical protein